MLKNIVIIGSSGAIGNSFVEHYLKEETVEKIFTFPDKFAGVES